MIIVGRGEVKGPMRPRLLLSRLVMLFGSIFFSACNQATPPQPSPGFSISLFPSAITIPQGESRQITVAIASKNGFSGEIILALANVPEGIAITPSRIRVSSEGLQQIPVTLVVLHSVNTGVYAARVEARSSSGVASDARDIQITVVPGQGSQPEPNFSISLSPKSLSLAPGQSGSVTLSVSTSGGLSGTLSLSLTGAPEGVSLYPEQLTITGANSQHTLSLRTTSASPPGSYTLTLRATLGNLTRLETLQLDLLPSPSASFTLSDPSPGSLTIQAGGSQTTQVTFTPTGNFTGTVNLSLVDRTSGNLVNGFTLSPTSVNLSGSPVTQILTVNVASSVNPGNYALKIRAQSGNILQERNLEVAVVAPPSSGGPRAWYYRPDQFQNGTLTLQIPSPGQNVLLALTPNVIFSEYGRNNFWEAVYSVQVDRGQFLANVTVGHAIPTPTRFTPEVWTSPYQAPVSPPAQRRAFRIWDGRNQRYVDTEGILVHQGSHFLYYEETASGVAHPRCFTSQQYQTIDTSASSVYTLLTRLMGEPVDFDGNRRVIVYLSTTVAQLEGLWTAYFEPYDIDPRNPNRAEIIYFPCGDWGDVESYVSSWFPRNIIHETVHLLQTSHAYRRGTPDRMHYAYIGVYREGQAELFRLKRVGFDRTMGVDVRWGELRGCLSGSKRTLSVLSCYYQITGLWHYWAHERFGEGFEQRLIEAVYQSNVDSSAGPHQRLVGLPESLSFALAHLSLALDDSPVGESLNLHFPRDNVLASLGLTSIPEIALSRTPISIELGHFESALVRVSDYQAGETIRVQVNNPRGLFVVLVTW